MATLLQFSLHQLHLHRKLQSMELCSALLVTTSFIMMLVLWIQAEFLFLPPLPLFPKQSQSCVVHRRDFHCLAHNGSPKNLLLLGVLGIAPLPLLWACSQNFTWLCMTQIVSGFFWAVYELSTLLLIMKNYREEITKKKMKCFYTPS